MQKQSVSPVINLDIGDHVYLDRPCFMRRDDRDAYDTYGTVDEIAMVTDGIPSYVKVFFPHIGVPLMLSRASLVRGDDNTIICCVHHDIDKGNKHNTCSCKYTSVNTYQHA